MTFDSITADASQHWLVYLSMPIVAALLGRLIPGSWGTIDQDTIGAAFVREFERSEGRGVQILHNREMRGS